MLYLCILLVCSFVLCKSDIDYLGSKQNENFAIIDSIYQEPECSTQGGMCVIGSDCDGNLTKQRGLCPKQAYRGVECCNGLSRKETRCEKVGGVCMPLDEMCSQKLIFRKDTTCNKQKCCILVN